jgi:hypothetical protein
VQVLAGLPDEQRAAVLAARAEGALDLQDGESDLDEVGGKLTAIPCIKLWFSLHDAEAIHVNLDLQR